MRKNGAFFSEMVYIRYGALRSSLERLTKDLADGPKATEDEMEWIYDIIRGPLFRFGPDKEQRLPGLGSFLKDELGSYITAVVSAAHHEYPEFLREMLHNDPEALLRAAKRSRK